MADSREKIYNPNIATMLIGCLLQDASLTYSTKYPHRYLGLNPKV